MLKFILTIQYNINIIKIKYDIPIKVVLPHILKDSLSSPCSHPMKYRQSIQVYQVSIVIYFIVLYFYTLLIQY
jgi:hypothetical protein